MSWCCPKWWLRISFLGNVVCGRMDTAQHITIRILQARVEGVDMGDILAQPQYSWFISKVLHTVRFLFKNKFISQNTFTGLQCNLHCALSQQSNVWTNLVFQSGRLRFWCVWLLRSESGGLSQPDFDLFSKLKKQLRGKRFRIIEEVSNEVTWVIRHIKAKGSKQEYKTCPNVGPLW
jgi:hypothetical protein